MMLVALNVGSYNTKVKTDNGRYIHPSKAQVRDQGIRTLMINGTCYEIGVGKRDIGDRSLSEVHEICTKYNILKLAHNESITLVVALPMGLYLNKDYRIGYQKKLTGEHVGVVDGVQKRAIVKECIVFAEGAAAYLPYKAQLKDRVVGVLDFGGNTINCMIYSFGDLQKDTISTLDLGMIKLERLIIDTLNIEKGWNVQEYEVREIIQTGEEKEIVNRCILEHLGDIKQRLLEKKWNIDRLTIFATGGGSVDLQEQLEKTFNRVVVSKSGVFDNVEGLWMVGGEINGKKTY